MLTVDLYYCQFRCSVEYPFLHGRLCGGEHSRKWLFRSMSQVWNERHGMLPWCSQVLKIDNGAFTAPYALSFSSIAEIPVRLNHYVRPAFSKNHSTYYLDTQVVDASPPIYILNCVFRIWFYHMCWLIIGGKIYFLDSLTYLMLKTICYENPYDIYTLHIIYFFFNESLCPESRRNQSLGQLRHV